MTVHIIEACDYANAAPIMTSMFQQRARVFGPDGFGWVGTRNGVEIDDLDRFHRPVYVVAESNGNVAGSIRLLPTVGMTFHEVAYPDVELFPVDPFCWELSRFTLEGNLSHKVDVTLDLYGGLAKVVARASIRELFCDVTPLMTAFLLWLGHSQQSVLFEHSHAIAASYAVSPELIENLIARNEGLRGI